MIFKREREREREGYVTGELLAIPHRDFISGCQLRLTTAVSIVSVLILLWLMTEAAQVIHNHLHPFSRHPPSTFPPHPSSTSPIPTRPIFPSTYLSTRSSVYPFVSVPALGCLRSLPSVGHDCIVGCLVFLSSWQRLTLSRANYCVAGLEPLVVIA